MTAVVVDTDVASAILKGRLPEHLDQLIAGRQLAITFVTVGELTRGRISTAGAQADAPGSVRSSAAW